MIIFLLSVLLSAVRSQAVAPIKPKVPLIGDYDCGVDELLATVFLTPGMRAYGEKVPEGNIQALLNSSCGSGCVDLRFTSGALNRDGQTHTVSSVMIPAFGESLLRGTTVVIEAAASLPTANGTSLLSDDDLFLSWGVASDENYTMWEFQDSLVQRDGKFRIYTFEWKQPLYKRMYQTCQSNGTAGVCTLNPECSSAGGKSYQSNGIVNKTFRVSGCHRFNNTAINCCVRSNLDNAQYSSPPPVSETKDNEVFAIRLKSRDTTGVAQVITIKRISICNDPCNGLCDSSKGMACDVSSKTCMCSNEFPWVRGPDGNCYDVYATQMTSYPCKMCPRWSSYTYYDSFSGAVKAGIDRLRCVAVPGNKTASNLEESCCGFECECAPGFEPSDDIPLSPNIKSCKPATSPTPAPNTSSNNSCPYPCKLPMICGKTNYCICDETQGWIYDPNVPIPLLPRCIRNCANCAVPELCRQPSTPNSLDCECQPGFIGVNEGGLLKCATQCTVPCPPPQFCVPGNKCSCPAGTVISGSSCVKPVTMMQTTNAQDSRLASMRSLFGCGAPCQEREECIETTGKCECRDIYTRVGTECVDQCDACRMRLLRATCTGPLPSDCKCAETLVEENGACVPRRVATAPTTVKPTQGMLFGIESTNFVMIIGIAVGGCVCLMILIGVLICAFCICSARRQQAAANESFNQGMSIQMKSDAAREGNPLYERSSNTTQSIEGGRSTQGVPYPITGAYPTSASSAYATSAVDALYSSNNKVAY